MGDLGRSFDKDLKKIRKLTVKLGAGGKPRFFTGWKKRLVLVLVVSQLALIALPPFIRPVGGPVTSIFFFRIRPDDPAGGVIETHEGLDIAAPAGTRVQPSAIGIVAESGYRADLGNYVVVRHLFGIETRYLHLAEPGRPAGSLVWPYILPIGRVGSTGRSTGAHLHFEIRIGGRAWPPRFFLVYHTIRKGLIGV